MDYVLLHREKEPWIISGCLAPVFHQQTGTSTVLIPSPKCRNKVNIKWPNLGWDEVADTGDFGSTQIWVNDNIALKTIAAEKRARRLDRIWVSLVASEESEAFHLCFKLQIDLPTESLLQLLAIKAATGTHASMWVLYITVICWLEEHWDWYTLLSPCLPQGVSHRLSNALWRAGAHANL